MNIIGTDFDDVMKFLMTEVKKKKVSITLNCGADGGFNIDISPYEPFHYDCPNHYEDKFEKIKSDILNEIIAHLNGQ